MLIYYKYKYKIDSTIFSEVSALKRFLFVIVALAILFIYPFFNFFTLGYHGKNEKPDTGKGLAVIEKFDAVKLEKVQKKIDVIEKERIEELERASRYKQAEETFLRLDQGKISYRRLFSKVYIAGDSLMEGLEAYDILNSKHIIAQVSASLHHLEENFDKIVAIRPPILILHYGLNMISTDEAHANSFIRQYKGIIEKLKTALPDSRIVVSLIFPVDTTVATAPRFKGIRNYNSKLKAMCAEMGIEYLDSAPAFAGRSEYYGSDGIHLSASFYRKYWLKYVISEMGIY